MTDDLVKSVMDNQYNRLDGKELDLDDILIKYWNKRHGIKMRNLDTFTEDFGISKEKLIEYQEWHNDGKPTGIESDEQFYEIQMLQYGKIMYLL